METANKGLFGSNELGLKISSRSQSILRDVFPVFYELITEFNSQGKMTKAYYKELVFEDDGLSLVTNYSVHTSVNTKDENFNIMDVKIAFINELEITFPENVRSIRLNRDTTKNELGIEEVFYFDTGSLLSAKNMFAGCWDLTKINFTSTTENILDMDSMFSMCGKLEAVPGNLNTSNCLTMNRMFDYCVKLKSIPEDFDTSACTSMQATFRGCRELASIPSLVVTNVKNFKECFEYCQTLDTIPELDTVSARNMNKMFLGCRNLTEVKDLNTPNLETLEAIFKGCSLLGSVGVLFTGKIKYFDDVFNGCKLLNEGPQWDTSSAISMARMFKDCEQLRAIPLYNMRLVRNVEEMFYNCSSIMTEFTEVFDIIEVEREPEVITKIVEIEVEEVVEVKDENGKPVLGPDGEKLYETIIVKKEQEVSEVIWHEIIKNGTISVQNCLDKRMW